MEFPWWLSGLRPQHSVHGDAGSVRGLRIHRCHEPRPRSQVWLRSAWLWLWCRPAAAAPVRPLAWEPPYAVGEALKSQKTHTHTNISMKQSQTCTHEGFFWATHTPKKKLCPYGGQVFRSCLHLCCTNVALKLRSQELSFLHSVVPSFPDAFDARVMWELQGFWETQTWSCFPTESSALGSFSKAWSRVPHRDKNGCKKATMP